MIADGERKNPYKRQLPKTCKYCGEENPRHWPFQCFKNPKRKKYSINKIGKVAKQMQSVREVWFRENPPNGEYYYCYLGISNYCPNRLLPIETFLDHVKPRSRFPELRYDLLNLMPICYWCNTLKGSKSLEEALKLKGTD